VKGYRDFTEEPHNRARGANAEEAAVSYLRRHGYQIEDRNVRNKAGEIDVIARDGDTLCFIEVKARASHRYGDAVEAVDWRKQQRIARAASLHLALQPWNGPCRFDVLGLDPARDGWQVTLVKNAFQLPDA